MLKNIIYPKFYVVDAYWFPDAKSAIFTPPKFLYPPPPKMDIGGEGEKQWFFKFYLQFVIYFLPTIVASEDIHTGHLSWNE